MDIRTPQVLHRRDSRRCPRLDAAHHNRRIDEQQRLRFRLSKVETLGCHKGTWHLKNVEQGSR